MLRKLFALSFGISILALSGCSFVEMSKNLIFSKKNNIESTPVAVAPKKSPYLLPGDKLFSEIPKKRVALHKKVIVIDLELLAWAAYDENGRLVKMGKASGGKSYCSDTKESCKTVVGTFAIYSKKGADCKSGKFPLKTNGGAPMPYCMHFYKGYVLHGSSSVPAHNSSHGCVRVLPSSAKWINEKFAKIGTLVIVKPYIP